ncbi:MAG: hypothetical protein LT105_09115 [Lentimicrobium sp.]|jgi:hypothetical protein|nr:hypothetical protein [Lentimicrobium sp.]
MLSTISDFTNDAMIGFIAFGREAANAPVFSSLISIAGAAIYATGSNKTYIHMKQI